MLDYDPLQPFSLGGLACEPGEKANRWQEAVEVLQWLLEGRTQPNVIACTSLISACSGEGHWEQALALFSSMTSWEVCPNVISYNTTISACEKAAQWQRALQLLQLAKIHDVTPDVISFNTTISACARAGAWEHAIFLLQEIGMQKLEPTLISLNAGISAFDESYSMAAVLAATGPSWELRIASERHHVQLRNECMCTSWWMEQAAQMLAQTISKSLWPNVLSYSAAISACEKAGNSKAGGR